MTNWWIERLTVATVEQNSPLIRDKTIMSHQPSRDNALGGGMKTDQRDIWVEEDTKTLLLPLSFTSYTVLCLYSSKYGGDIEITIKTNDSPGVLWFPWRGFFIIASNTWNWIRSGGNHSTSGNFMHTSQNRKKHFMMLLMIKWNVKDLLWWT